MYFHGLSDPRLHHTRLVKDRLYLIEAPDEEADEEGELINPLCGRRIFVQSLQGDTLQVYTHPIEGQHFDGLCCFDKQEALGAHTKEGLG